MYALDLICSNGHRFESWFKSRNSFEEQQADGIVICPHCGDNSIKQEISPARIGRHSERHSPIQRPEAIPQLSPSKIRELVEKNFEDVGEKFPDEALKIHYGESEKRGIRGTATADEERELIEEGVPVFKIPNIQ